MRSFQIFLGIILLSIFIFSSCNENISDPQPVASNDQNSLAKDPAEVQQILSYLQQNNIEKAAFFFDVSNTSFGFGIVDFITGKNAWFFGTFGPGDFLRMNPDGSYSVLLNTNQADAWIIDFATFGFYTCTGTAKMNYKFSGTDLTYVPGAFISLIADASISAQVCNGQAQVTLDGLGGDPHTLQSRYIANPGGQGHWDVIFN